MAKTSFSQKKVKKRGISCHSGGILNMYFLLFVFGFSKSFFCKILCLSVLKSNKVIFFRFLLLNFLKTTKVFFEENLFSDFQISRKFFFRNFSFLIFKTRETFFWEKTKNYFFKSHKTIFSQKSKTFFSKAKRIKTKNKNPLHWLETAFILMVFRENQLFWFFPSVFLFFQNAAGFISITSNLSQKC